MVMKKREEKKLKRFLKLIINDFYIDYERVPNLLEIRFLKNEILKLTTYYDCLQE